MDLVVCVHMRVLTFRVRGFGFRSGPNRVMGIMGIMRIMVPMRCCTLDSIMMLYNRGVRLWEMARRK